MNDACRERLRAVEERIARACERAGRARSEVRLLAVSKYHPVSAIRALYAEGLREFGENYAQDLAEKAEALSDLPELRWHFIGGFQKNKAKLLLPSRCTLQTLASQAHAEVLGARARAAATQVSVLIQVNVAREPQKSGVLPEALPALIDAVRRASALSLEGLMVIPPADDLARARESFRALRALAAAHALRELSMGMSGDLELAIEEGATIVRVGTALFGPRPA